jgi:hypothetical protein
MKERKDWKLSEWVKGFEINGEELPPLTLKDIQTQKHWLRKNYYPVPVDCPKAECIEHRPACGITCKVAMCLCKDW